jgi:hypothetical protein
VITFPRQRLKTVAEQRKQQQHHRRAEFFALPILVSATPNRPFAQLFEFPNTDEQELFPTDAARPVPHSLAG